MKQYHDLVQHILDNGTRKENRTGVDTISTFGYYFEHDLRDGFPLLTTKNISWKNIVVEMLWFLSGQQDISILKRHGCKFWDAWADSNGKVPSAYGNFWRRFPVHGVRDSSDHTIDGDECCAYNDQIKWVLSELRKNPMSRRMVVSAWAPGNAQFSKLPPCHSIFMLNVQNEEGPIPAVAVFDAQGNQVPQHGLMEKRLCLHLTQRSADCLLGIPYNIASYGLLLSLFSRFSGIEPGIFGHSFVDAHIYTAKPDGSMAVYDHIPVLREQLRRAPRPLPRLHISDEMRDLEDVERLMHPSVTTDEILGHFVLENYDPWPALQGKVAV